MVEKAVRLPRHGRVTRLGGMAVALALVWSGHWQTGTGLAIFILIVP
ncbi:hypothetical protein [Acidithiobacillus sulfuriphilus]|uniref:Uncharacterized protein n=1 Tax=Acidithiobacillus sulfuriphilus TaxID=1867749 RepID=A0ACD5HN92_9PROT